MKHVFEVKGVVVLMSYLQLGGGYVCQLLIEHNPEDVLSLHRTMTQCFESHYAGGGMMENKLLSPNVHPDLGRSVFTEIRLINTTIMWVVDTLRLEGISVVEKDPIFS